MRSYAQYCPVAKATEVLGDRWTLLIVREMLGGASGFNELQRGLQGSRARSSPIGCARSSGPKSSSAGRAPKAAPSSIASRPPAATSSPLVQAMGEWGVTWSFTDPRPEELDPDLLIVWMARHVDREQLPADRIVVQFDFRDPKRRYWMVLEPSEVSVCLQHPGFEVDLEVKVDTATLYSVYLGRAELGGAARARKLTMSGPRALQRSFGRWFPGARSPREPLRATAPHGRLTPCRPSSGTDRRRRRSGHCTVSGRNQHSAAV